MGEMISITAADGFSFSAYQALPEGKAKASVLIIQEIFGINQHIKEVCDGYAEKGFVAIAPALFDRIKPGATFAYDSDGIEQGREYALEKLQLENTILDLTATAELLSQHGKTTAIGYCFGGFLAYIAATELTTLSSAVSYYGARIAQHLERKPLVPVLFHFSDNDPGIPMTDVEQIDQHFPDFSVHVYPAKHGFNCNLRDTWHQQSASLALERTLDFIDELL